MFLYILKFQTGNMMKIGIAKNNNRVKSHMNTYGDYGIDLESSYKIKAKSVADIRLLERQLLGDYSDFATTKDNLHGRDGYTEIRCSSVLDEMLEDIRYKTKRFPQKEFKMQKGIKVKLDKIGFTKIKELEVESIALNNEKIISNYIGLLNRNRQKINRVEYLEDGFMGGIRVRFNGLGGDEIEDIMRHNWSLDELDGGCYIHRPTIFTEDGEDAEISVEFLFGMYYDYKGVAILEQKMMKWFKENQYDIEVFDKESGDNKTKDSSESIESECSSQQILGFIDGYEDMCWHRVDGKWIEGVAPKKNVV